MSAEEQPSRAAGACVLVVLAGVLVAVAFAIDEAFGVLLVVVSGAVALWRSARRLSDSSATPPPEGAAHDSDEYAGRNVAKARVAMDPSGVMCTYHEAREEEVTDDDPTPPRRTRLRATAPVLLRIVRRVLPD